MTFLMSGNEHMNTISNQLFQTPRVMRTCLLCTFMALLSLFTSGCTVLSIADAAVSGTVAVISTGVSATTSVVKAVLPSGKEAAK